MRSQEALHLESSPLVFVLAQVKISPILKMPDFVPDIQEQLRKRGFPGYQHRTTQEIIFGPVPQTGQTERWFFIDNESTSAVILAPSFVVLAASSYDRFEEFAATLEVTLDVLKATCSPAHSSRLGLRYVDLIRVAEGQSLGTYLQPGIRGLKPEELGASALLHQMQLRGQTSVGVLSVRLWQNSGGPILPPDIARDELPFPFDSPAPDEVLTILDIDHFSEEQRDFEPAALIRDMWALHDGTDLAFRAVVTSEARQLWGDTSLPDS